MRTPNVGKVFFISLALSCAGGLSALAQESENEAANTTDVKGTIVKVVDPVTEVDHYELRGENYENDNTDVYVLEKASAREALSKCQTKFNGKVAEEGSRATLDNNYSNPVQNEAYYVVTDCKRKGMKKKAK
jgi:hypothetical protein